MLKLVILRLLLCAVCSLTLPAATLAQDAGIGKESPRNTFVPDSAQWAGLTNDAAFFYRDSVEYTPKPPEPIREERPSVLWRLIRAILKFFGTTLGHIILWGIAIGLVGLLIYILVRNQGWELFGRKRAISTTEAGVETEDLYGAHWERLLEDALQRGDTRAAIRCSYMILLQNFQERGLIDYRESKTNAAYLRELRGTSAHQAFRNLSRQYEYAWYGNILPDQAGLSKYLGLFRQTVRG